MNEYERLRKREDMNKYKEDLDKYRSDKESLSRRHPTENIYQPVLKHNPVSNPLPYNLQNPYILKQLEKNNPGVLKNSYLANIGISNFYELNK
jgi:hypothetical protein